MQLLFFKILLLVLLINFISGFVVTPCSNFFHYVLDESNRVNSGIINLNLTSGTANPGFTLELVFGTKNLPVEGQDIPRVELLTEKSQIQEIIDRNDALKYGVKYNLEKPIPKLIKIVLHGPGIINVPEKLVCMGDKDFTHQVHLRAFTHLDPVRRRLNITVPRFTFYKRNEWTARNSTRSLPILVTPVQKIIWMYTHTLDCGTVAKCIDAVKDIQTNFMNQGADDMPYNFLVGGDGNVYEGVGIEFQGNHTTENNNNTIGIAFLGESTEYESHVNKVRVTKVFVDFLIEKKYVTQNFTISHQRKLHEMSY